VPIAPKTGIVDERDHLFNVIPGNGHLREGGHSLKILKPMFDAVFDIAGYACSIVSAA